MSEFYLYVLVGKDTDFCEIYYVGKTLRSDLNIRIEEHRNGTCDCTRRLYPIPSEIQLHDKAVGRTSDYDPRGDRAEFNFFIDNAFRHGIRNVYGSMFTEQRTAEDNARLRHIVLGVHGLCYKCGSAAHYGGACVFMSAQKPGKSPEKSPGRVTHTLECHDMYAECSSDRSQEMLKVNNRVGHHSFRDHLQNDSTVASLAATRLQPVSSWTKSVGCWYGARSRFLNWVLCQPEAALSHLATDTRKLIAKAQATRILVERQEKVHGSITLSPGEYCPHVQRAAKRPKNSYYQSQTHRPD